MSRIAYVNGRYRPLPEAAVNVEDRGYQFADAIYEVVHVHGGRPIDADLHLDRLDRSLAAIRVAPPMRRAALLRVLAEVARRNRLRAGLIYIQVTRGVARRDHAFPGKPVPPALVVTMRRLPAYPLSPDAWAVGAVTRPDERWARVDIKSTGLLPNVLARQSAREAGAFEAVLVDGAGGVTEGASTTVWIVDADGVLRTRHLDRAVLPGCTRDRLARLAAEVGVMVAERGFTAAEMAVAREAFLTSATSFVKPLVRLNDAPIGDGAPGPLTRKLFALYAAHVGATGRNAT